MGKSDGSLLRFDNSGSVPVAAGMPRAVGAGGSYDAFYTASNSEVGTPRRRYVGRSTVAGAGKQPVVDSGEALRRAAGETGPARPSASAGIRQRLAHSIAMPWSLRLVVAVALISATVVVLRLPGLLTPAVDAPAGVEATNAAFASTIAGQTAGALDPARLLPPPAPWYGAAPANPIASFPLYGWLVAGVMTIAGPGAWVGRAVSIIFSLLGGLFLFATLRRTAGARAALYALVFYAAAPLSVVLGQQYSPAAMVLAAQSSTVLLLVRWRTLDGNQRGGRAGLAFACAVLSACILALLDPGGLFMIVPAIYVVIMPAGSGNPFARGTGLLASWAVAWRQSADRGKAVAMACALAGPSLLWWAFSQTAASELSGGSDHAGLASPLLALLSGGTYVEIVGLTVERLLTVAGLLLLGVGLLHAARPPLQMLYHAWLAAGLLHVILDASRLPGSEDVLLPLILPACALAGIGAAWAGALPARMWLAINEQNHDKEAEYAVSPHTAWLLDLPEQRVRHERPSRPQAQLALSRSIAQRSQAEQLKLRRAWLLASGHVAVVVALLLIISGGLPGMLDRLKPSAQDAQLAAIGNDVAGLVPAGARLIVAGPYAPELFYSSGHTGWALPTDQFGIARVQELQAQGAQYLLSADQDWLGHHQDYRGLITSYSVLKLTQDYILFDLNTKPADSDRLYFLESGHTLGGAFRTYWESHGGVAKLGYPISEEVVQPSPLDGQSRTVQYFERAVLEFHQERAGTSDQVMLASVGLWVSQGHNFPHVQPFDNTADDWYFPQTGHSVKQAFLRYWQQQGGVTSFGYPISEELPEINPVDGKVYTVQYFERARFEWHPTFAGTPDEVQLGLIGKQALEMFGK